MGISVEWRLFIYPFLTEQKTYSRKATLLSPLCPTLKSVSATQDFCGKPIPALDPEGWTDGVGAGGGVSLCLFTTPLRFCK